MESPTSERITIDEQRVETQRIARKVPKGKPVGTCLVCNLEVNTSDIPVCCPHCCNAFHRNHLIEWIHVRKRCPACGEHLEERELKELPLHVQRRPRTKGG